MTTTELARPSLTRRVPPTVRGAQLLLLVPLLQLVASIAFSINLGLRGGGDWTVASVAG